MATGASKNLFAHRHFLGHLTCWLVAFRRPGLLACRLASPSGGLLTARFVCFLCCWSVVLSCQFLVLVWQLAPPKLMQYYEHICTYIYVCMFLVMGFMSQLFFGKRGSNNIKLSINDAVGDHTATPALGVKRFVLGWAFSLG